MSTPVRWVPWEDRKTITRHGPHVMTRKILSWLCCARCGLLALKNAATRAALRTPCEWIDDA